MSSSGGLLQRIGHYSLARAATMAAGLISYPILTRVLSPEEYGVMGLVLTLLNLTIGVSKLGLQFSTVRLWAAWDDSEQGRQRFVLTFFTATLLAGLSVTVIYNAVSQLLARWIGHELAYFILLSSPLIVARALDSFGRALLNARQQSKQYALFEVLHAYAAMVLAVLGAAVLIGGLRGYYIGLVSGEALVTLGLIAYVLRGVAFRRDNLHFPLVREAVTFGFPMSIYELTGVLFYTGDRFIILWLLDKASLGYYTVAFNLTTYVNQLFAMPVNMTVQPAVTSLYEKQGSEAASEFLRVAARWFFLFCAAAVAGMVMIREDLLALLASKKFLPAAELAPVLLTGLLVASSRDILGAGMFLKKRPWLMAAGNLVGATLNGGLNLALIPWLGIGGAATATLISQLVITMLFWLRGSRLVRVQLAWGALFLHMLCAAAMAGILHFIDPGPGVVRLVLRMAAGVVSYTGLVLLVDGEARRVAGRVVDRIRRR